MPELEPLDQKNERLKNRLQRIMGLTRMGHLHFVLHRDMGIEALDRKSVV